MEKKSLLSLLLHIHASVCICLILGFQMSVVARGAAANFWGSFKVSLLPIQTPWCLDHQHPEVCQARAFPRYDTNSQRDQTSLLTRFDDSRPSRKRSIVGHLSNGPLFFAMS